MKNRRHRDSLKNMQDAEKHKKLSDENFAKYLQQIEQGIQKYDKQRAIGLMNVCLLNDRTWVKFRRECSTFSGSTRI